MARIEPIVGRYVHVDYAGKDYRITTRKRDRAFPVCLHTAHARMGGSGATSSATPTSTRTSASSPWICRVTGNRSPPDGWWKEGEVQADGEVLYSEFVIAFCRALGLEKPVIMGSSMGGNICLHLALNYSDDLSALIAIEAASTPGLVAPGSTIRTRSRRGGLCDLGVRPDGPAEPGRVSLETWWYHSQGGPGIFKGDLYFYSVDHDFRGKCEVDPERSRHFITGNTTSRARPR
jgi:pimeloyl-ACP methyl ester carboxylesterase